MVGNGSSDINIGDSSSNDNRVGCATHPTPRFKSFKAWTELNRVASEALVNGAWVLFLYLAVVLFLILEQFELWGRVSRSIPPVVTTAAAIAVDVAAAVAHLVPCVTWAIPLCSACKFNIFNHTRSATTTADATPVAVRWFASTVSCFTTRAANSTNAYSL